MPHELGDTGPRKAGTIRSHLERYLGSVHGAILGLGALLAVLCMPSDRELSTKLAGDAMGSAALRQAKLELAELAEDATPLDRARAWRRIGVAQGLTGDVEGMLASLRNAIGLAPDWLAGRLALADALDALAEPSQETPVLLAALALADRIAALEPGEQRRALLDFALPRGRPPTRSELPEALGRAVLPWRTRAAHRLAFDQRTDEAIEQYRRLLQASPQELPVAIRLVQLLAQQGRTEDARLTLAQLLERVQPVLSPARDLAAEFRKLPAPASRRVLRALMVQWHLRLPGPAFGPLAKLLGLPCSSVSGEDDGATASTEVAVIDLLRAGTNLDEAQRLRLRTLQDYLQLEPANATLQLERARLLESAGNYSGALAVYRDLRARAGDPAAHGDAVLRLLGAVGTYAELGRELGSRYERTRELDSGLWLAMLHSWNENHREAEAAFRMLLRNHPGNASVLRGLARALQAQEKHREAIEVLRALLARLPATGGGEAASPEPAGPRPLPGPLPASGRTLPETASGEPPAAVASPAGPAARTTDTTDVSPPEETGPPAGPPAGEPLRRRLLALYLREVEEGAEGSRIHRQLEVVLDHLGFVLDYRAIEDGLPRPEEMSPYEGVVTWFDLPAMPGASDFVRWLAAQSRAGRKLVMMGGLGALVDAGDGRRLAPRELQEALGPLGLSHDGAFAARGTALQVARRVARLVEYERPLGREPLYFEGVRSVAPGNEVFLSLEVSNGTTRALSDAVVLSPGGLYVSPGYGSYEDPSLHRNQLRVDAFTLLARLFDVARAPVPDPTTVNGRRAALVHVDGDGASNATSLRGYGMCIDVLFARIFERHPFEQTVSFIAGEIDPARLGTEPLRRRARELYRLPWIEPAAHSYSHPFDWRNPRANIDQALKFEYNHGLATFDTRRELVGSSELIAELAPSRQAAPLLLWSGSCNPDRKLLSLARQWGVLNLNGGDGAFDGLRPSVTSLAPFVRTVEGEHQFLTPQANEFYLTDAGRQPLWAFRKLLQTWERSESPRRLEAMNLYYHHYIARSEDGLRILETLYESLLGHAPAFIPASERIRMIQGFRSTRLARLGPGRFLVEGAGRCLTLRCDPGLGIPDLSASTGVAGYCDGPGGVRYVHLVPGSRQEVAFEPVPAKPPLRLVSSTLRLGDWNVGADRAEARMLGFGEAVIELQGAWLAGGATPELLGPGRAPSVFTATWESPDRLRLETTARGILYLTVTRPR